MKIKQGYELFVGLGGKPGSGYYPRTYFYWEDEKEIPTMVKISTVPWLISHEPNQFF